MTGDKGADLVLDAVGGPMFEPSLKSLRRGGRQIAITSTRIERLVSISSTSTRTPPASLV
jgi:NADPH2:quinone reductase